jgi:tyrosyl-DNA phosphodiesterase 2
VTQRLSLTSRNIDTWTQRLSLISWNIDAFSSRPVSRAKLILSHILEGPKSPDILFLQEVTPDVRASLLDDARVRVAFLVTDAEDQTSFEDKPFATMTLLSSARFASGGGSESGLESLKEGDGIEGGENFMLGRVSRVTLPSKYRRDALYVDIIPPTAPGTVFRLVNVHLDSLWDTLHYRAQQMEILANVLREPGCGGGILAGDFNAINPEDDGLIDKNELVDAWVALHGRDRRADPDGATWGVGVERRGGLGPGRLDKVAMMGLKAKEMEVLRPGHIEVPRPGEKPVEIPWSDHCGLRCTFTI